MFQVDPSIQTEGLTCYFGSTAALRGLTLAIPHGQITALIGHNGAGKTTLIRTLLGFMAPTRGRSEILGCDSQQLTPCVRSRIGYLAEGHFLWGWMRANDVARMQSETFALWDQKLFDSIIRYFGIKRETRVGQLSRGQRAGVSLAMTLATDPELLVLDDPSMGLDPVARRALVEGLLSFARRPERTILICTHLVDDVERLADRLVIIGNGQLRVDAQLTDFRERVGGWILTGQIHSDRVSQIPGLIDLRRVGDRIHIVVADPNEETEAAIVRLGGRAEREKLSFEDAVLAYLRPAAMVGSISAALEESR